MQIEFFERLNFWQHLHRLHTARNKRQQLAFSELLEEALVFVADADDGMLVENQVLVIFEVDFFALAVLEYRLLNGHQ